MNVIMFPGQGSQRKGMGKELFSRYSYELKVASDILGYDLQELCIDDPNRCLNNTQYTQPALFVVNALGYLEQKSQLQADYFIGHSLGEYNALFAAGAFDFDIGVKLVQERGRLMASASGGGMAAVLGLSADELSSRLKAGNYTDIDVANFNSPTQLVISGTTTAIENVYKDFERDGIRSVLLNVTAPFHSRYMQAASEEYAQFLRTFEFSSLTTPVISNVSARPYKDDQIEQLLSEQIASPVNWIDTVRYLNGKGVNEYQEIGSQILTKMVHEISQNCEPITEADDTFLNGAALNRISANEVSANGSASSGLEISHGPTALGSKAFRDEYGVKYSYVVGSMYRGIASKELVVLVARANILSFLGAGGLSLRQIEDDIDYIQTHLGDKCSFGVNLLHNLTDTDMELKTVKLLLSKNIKIVEASAFMQITPALVYYRLSGLLLDAQGVVHCDNKIIAKVSRPEVAEAFMRPAPERLVAKLLEQGLVTKEQAELSQRVPMSYDICVEADSGGHTDSGVAMVLLPSIQKHKETIEKDVAYPKKIRMGLAGGIGTPQSVACAFVMGADFVLTGSINQATVESGTSSPVKDLLQAMDVQDTAYAPAGDMFEIGARIQVLKKGVLFPGRANKLYELYQHYDSIEEIPQKTLSKIEELYFKKSIEDVWQETKDYLIANDRHSDLLDAERTPKAKMALIFRWYFAHSNRLSSEGNTKEKVNFQIHTGPALGAFNQWVKGTPLENWKNRHADKIGTMLMEQAAKILEGIN